MLNCWSSASSTRDAANGRRPKNTGHPVSAHSSGRSRCQAPSQRASACAHLVERGHRDRRADDSPHSRCRREANDLAAFAVLDDLALKALHRAAPFDVLPICHVDRPQKAGHRRPEICHRESWPSLPAASPPGSNVTSSRAFPPQEHDFHVRSQLLRLQDLLAHGRVRRQYINHGAHALSGEGGRVGSAPTSISGPSTEPLPLLRLPPRQLVDFRQQQVGNLIEHLRVLQRLL